MKLGKVSLASGALVVLGAVLWFGSAQLDGKQVSKYTSNAGELAEGAAVGQTFVGERDNLSSIAVMMATYSGRASGGQVRLTVRRLDNLTQVLREVKVPVEELGDNQVYRFSFEPLVEAEDVIFLALLEVPGGRAGQTVTVDVNNEDPYHQGTAYILRGANSQLTEQELGRGGKPKMDIVFGTAYQVPLYVAVGNKAMAAERYFVSNWHEAKATYALWGRVALQSMLLLGVCLAAAVGLTGETGRIHNQRTALGWLALLFVMGVVVRFLYAVELPVTNDEGNYLYDAASLLRGKLAGGDGYVKAPLVVLWIALWEWLGGNTILVARMSSVVIGALTMWPIYIIGRVLWDRKIGVAAAAIWSLAGVTAVFNIYVHTQPLAMFLAVAGIAAILMGAKYVNAYTVSMDRRDNAHGWLWLVAGGCLLGLGVVSRKSVLAVGLVPLIIALAGIKNKKQIIWSLWLIGAGFIAVIAVGLAAAAAVYGQEGVWEGIGYNSAEDGIAAVEESEREQVRAYSIRGMTPFFREALPLIMLSMLGLGLTGERLMAKAAEKAGWLSTKRIWMLYGWQKLGWAVPVIIYGWAWSFFNEYEGSSVMVFGMSKLWWAMAAVIALVAAWPARRTSETSETGKTREPGWTKDARWDESQKESTQATFSREAVRWLLPVVWVGGLVWFYQHWIKFHANYIGEFLPPLAVIAGVAIPEIWHRLAKGRISNINIINKACRLAIAFGLIAVTGWSLFAANYVTFVYEHTGTFQLEALQEAADWARQNIPSNEKIFTGAAAVPYLSGHRVALDIAHPRWYAYGFTREDKQRLNTFLPSVEDMLQAYRDAKWLLMEQQTGFSFLMEFAEIESGLARDWRSVKGIENGSNTMTFYQRIR